MVKIGVDSLKISVCQDDVIFNFAAALCTPVKELFRFMLYRLEHHEHGLSYITVALNQLIPFSILLRL